MQIARLKNKMNEHYIFIEICLSHDRSRNLLFEFREYVQFQVLFHRPQPNFPRAKGV